MTNYNLKITIHTFGNAILCVIYRLVYFLFAPIFMIYMLFPTLWIIGIPYWILTNRDLMKDLCKMYGV